MSDAYAPDTPGANVKPLEYGPDKPFKDAEEAVVYYFTMADANWQRIFALEAALREMLDVLEPGRHTDTTEFTVDPNELHRMIDKAVEIAKDILVACSGSPPTPSRPKVRGND